MNPGRTFKTTVQHAILISLFLTGCISGLSLAAAQGSVDDVAVAARRALLNNKLMLLDRLANRSPSMQRIEQSDDAEAKQLLENARQAYQQANIFLTKNKFEQSGQFIDEGLRALSQAAQSVVDIRRQDDRFRRLYSDLKERVASFIKAFQAVVLEKGTKAVDLLDQGMVQELVAEAEDLAQAEHFKEANQRLVTAAGMLESALSRARDKETLVHALVFNSPEEEFAYELQRNDSYELLIKLMVSEETIVGSAQGYIQKKAVENQRIKEAAKALAEQGDLKAALSKIENATEQLVKALRMGGVGF